jgi:glycosyltransferase involved in cell wall biosynthesis
MKISVITASYNNGDTIDQTIRSVCEQRHDDVEHIIIDGGSTDRTMEVISSCRCSRPGLEMKVVSEKDSGVYDAMNKGISLAQGEIVGFLNADDAFVDHNVLRDVAYALRDEEIDACYGDLVYVAKDDPQKVVRYWRSTPHVKGLFAKAWVPPHPTFYARKRVYEWYGMFDLTYALAADYEFMARVMERHAIATRYIPQVMVKMRCGGVTNRSIQNMLRQNVEIVRACRANGIDLVLPVFFARKILNRIRQFCVSGGRQARHQITCE